MVSEELRLNEINAMNNAISHTCNGVQLKYRALYTHTVAIMRLDLSKKNYPLLLFTFLKLFFDAVLIF